MKMVVCNQFQLLRGVGGYTKQGMSLVRENQVITREYAEGMNNDFKNSGKWFEINEEATELYAKGKWKDGVTGSELKEAEVVEEEKPKRKRRTKSEIEADK